MKNGLMKKLMMSFACSVAVNAYAAGEGPYMGIMAGPATSTASSMLATRRYAPPLCDPVFGCNTPDPFATVPPGTTIANPENKQFAARIYIGNQFNRYAGIELGGVFFSTIRYNTNNVPTFGSTDQRVHAADLVLKGILPFGCSGFDIFGKLGVAATYITRGGSFNPEFRRASFIPPPVPPFPLPLTPAKLNVSQTSIFKFAPTVSFGASYDMDQRWVLDCPTIWFLWAVI